MAWTWVRVIEAAMLHPQPHSMAGGGLCIKGVYTGFPEASLSHWSPLPQMQVGMFKIHPEIPEVLSAEATAFLLCCFEPEPHKRATAADLLKENFLRKVYKGEKTQIASKPSGEAYQDSWVSPGPPGSLLLGESASSPAC